MKTNLAHLLLSYFTLLLPAIAISQKPFSENDLDFRSKRYIFTGSPIITKSDLEGNELSHDQFYKVRAQINSTFTVIEQYHAQYLIQVIDYNISKGMFESEYNHVQNLEKSLKYNTVTPAATFNSFRAATDTSGKTEVAKVAQPNEAYFLVTKDDLEKFAVEYNPKPRFEFAFGTISYLARMRPGVSGSPGKWTTDLSLGLAAGASWNINKNNSLGLLAGVAITKISLDSLSTRGVVTSVSEKPALTPNLNLLYSYKNFSVGVGVGMDWINDESKESRAWIYNNRLFYAVGFGINIFRSNNEEETAAEDQ